MSPWRAGVARRMAGVGSGGRLGGRVVGRAGIGGDVPPRGDCGSMAKPRIRYVCADCSHVSPKWAGRCPECGEWNTLAEMATASTPAPISAGPALSVPLSELSGVPVVTCSTGMGEVDRVLGGGLVRGSVTLVGGEPGIGKSTLLLQLAGLMASGGSQVLYVSAEESADQVGGRARRLGLAADGVRVASLTEIDLVESECLSIGPEVLILDSVQTVVDTSLPSGQGSVPQVREVTARLVRLAKNHGTTVILVGHVTKEGGLAGPRAMEHMVDTVLTFEGDRQQDLRTLRSVKHRFGSTREVGLFRMGARGLKEVTDASRTMLADRALGVPGSIVVPLLEGSRTLLVEIQALVSRPLDSAGPRRVTQGVDPRRLAMVLAVLEQRVGVSLARHDIHVSAVGGVTAAEPAVDLGLALAVVSALTSWPVTTDTLAFGEVGLGGEVRTVRGFSTRVREASRLGFDRVIAPPRGEVEGSDCRIAVVDSLAAGLESAGVLRGPEGLTGSIGGHGDRGSAAQGAGNGGPRDAAA